MELHRKRMKHFNDPGHAHVLTFSCHKRFPLLTRDRTRRWLVEALRDASREHDFAIVAYVIMPEHAHVVVHPRREQYNIAGFLKSVKQSVSRRARQYLLEHSPVWLSRLSVETPTGRVFRFWQRGGGYDRNIHNVQALLSEIQYIHGNPVRRGLVSEADEWEWSSARSYAGREDVLLRLEQPVDVFTQSPSPITPNR
jgi:putative transposase